MAREVKETPVLTGKAAEQFAEKIKENQDKPVSREAYTRAESTYERIKKVSKLGC